MVACVGGIASCPSRETELKQPGNVSTLAALLDKRASRFAAASGVLEAVIQYRNALSAPEWMLPTGTDFALDVHFLR